MYVQILLLLIIFIVGALMQNEAHDKSIVKYNHLRRNYIIFCCTLLVIQSGLRNVAVGADTYAYKLLFEDINNWTWDDVLNYFRMVYIDKEGKDAGYKILMKLFTLISSDYQFYLVCVAVFFFYALGNFLYKNTVKVEDIFLAIVVYQALFYEFFSITGTRQTIATAFCLLTYEQIKKNKLVKFIFIILIAVTIHKSALLFIPFFFVAKYKKSWILLVVSILCFPILFSISKLFAYQLALLSDSEEYLAYVEDITSGAWGFLFFYIFIALIGIWRYKKTIVIEDTYRLYNAFALALLFIPLTFTSSSLMRVVQYYSIYMLLFLPAILNTFSNKEKIKKQVLWFGLMVIFLYRIINLNYEFAWCWEYMKLGDNYFNFQ